MILSLPLSKHMLGAEGGGNAEVELADFSESASVRLKNTP